MKKSMLLLSLLLCVPLYAQDTLNKFDQDGLRHGPWIGYFEDAPDQVRYQGTFEHGNEVGLFKYYQLGHNNPAATKFFRPHSDTVDVEYLTQKGELISKGQMKDRKRVGEWKYYHQGSDKLMMTERYEQDVLHGPKITYFPNGQATENSFYKNGKLDGEMLIFSEKGVVLKQYHYRDGELHGPAKVYNGKGELLIEGQYKQDRHHGLWKYYENGKLTEEKDFSSR